MKIEGFSEEQVIEMAKEWYEFNPGIKVNHIKTFEQLREVIWEEKQGISEVLIDRLEELSDFELGMYKGQIMEMDHVLELLRKIIKYGDSE
jgi:hypothetical protein